MKRLLYKVYQDNSLITLLKWAALFILLLILYFNQIKNGHLSKPLVLNHAINALAQPWLLIALFLLTLINWTSDTLVWQRASKSIGHLSFSKALKHNIISQFLGVLLPMGIGEYGGKMRAFKTRRSKKLSLIVTLSYRISKTVAKLGIGLLAGIYLAINFQQVDLLIYIGIPSLLFTIIVLKSDLIYNFIQQHSFFLDKNASNESLGLKELKLKKNIVPATFKFLSYCVQFALLTSFSSQIGFSESLVSGIMIYAITSVIPQQSFLDPFIKYTIGFVLNPYSIPENVILMSTSLVWIFNTGVPAILGSMLWINVKKHIG